MLRINLLPSYVPQRRLTRKLILGFGALLALCVLVPLFLYMQAGQQKASWESQATDAEAGKAKTDALRTKAASTTAQIAPITAKLDYVKAVHQHNTDLVNFWYTVAAYSDKNVIYSDAVVSGNTLTIKAYTPSIAEVGRYLQAMYQEPDIQTVAIDRLPGYPEAVVSKVYYGNKLIATTNPGNSPAAGGGQGGGFSGPPPGSFGRGGPGPGGFGGGGAPQSAGGGAGQPVYGTPVAVGPGAASVPTVAAGTGKGAGQIDPQQLTQILLASRSIQNVTQNPFAGPQAQLLAVQSLVASLRKKITVRREPQGFPVTVTATLKQPLAAPPLPGAAPAAGVGGPGGPPGYPGGPGGPPAGFANGPGGASQAG